MTKVAVTEAVLSWAMERSGVAPAALRHRFPRLDAWRAGDAQPTLRQLGDFAKATATPVGFLLLDQPPQERLPIPHFRTVRRDSARRPSADLLETVYMMQRRQDWMREYLVEDGHEGLPFVGSARASDDTTVVAGDIRQTLGFSQTWAAGSPTWTDALRRLCDATEEAGILVVASGVVGNNTHRKLDVDEFCGFVLVDRHAPLVFLNAADASAAQMFTLAHALAHVWLGSSAAFDFRELQPAADATEQVCNRVAAELLVPQASLRDFWPRARQETEPFQAVARHFKVSVLVAARRALDLKLIREADFREFYRAYLEDEQRSAARTREAGDFYATQNLRVGKRFGRTVVQAVREGRLPYREGYGLTGLRGEAFERFASYLDGPRGSRRMTAG
jgi:Zn-dependent peptidase ImmA (M78 family)